MNAQDIKLPAPALTGGMPINEAVANRQSTRSFDPTREIDSATLGQLLWITAGVNRPDAKPSALGAPANRTNPTARNWQEIHVYVAGRNGVWLYKPETHSLTPISADDCRPLTAGTAEFSQEFVNDAPYCIILVADLTDLPDTPQVTAMAMVDTGIACENLNLACAAAGIATVPRATMDTAAISKALGLGDRQIPVINNPIGYAKIHN